MSTPDRLRVRRGARKGRYDRATVAHVLDRGLVAHVAFVDGGEPYCIPMLYAQLGDSVCIHASRGSRLARTLAGGAAACLTVTILDGIVLARSAFEHSANYESVMVFGRFRPVDDQAERLAALEAFTEKLVPGRLREVRPPSERELEMTAVLALPLETASAKVRTGGPDDDRSTDAALDTWAGVIPLRTMLGEPEPSPGLRTGIPLAESVRRLLEASGSSRPL